MDRTTKAIIGIGIVIVIVLIAMLVYSNISINGNVVKGGKESIVMGAILPLSGELAYYGQGGLNAITLAVNEINSAGGIDDRKIELVVEDSPCNPNKALTATNKLISIDRVKYLMGPMCSSELFAMAPLLEENDVVLISHATTHPNITSLGDYVFRNAASDNLRAKVFANYLYNSGVKEIAIIYELEDFGVGLKEAFVKEYSELGGKINVLEEYSKGASEVRTQLTKIKESNSLNVLMISFPTSTAAILKQSKELGMNVQFYELTEVMSDPQLAKTAGDAVNGVIYIQAAAPEGIKAEEFKAKYQAEYNAEPPYYAAEAYDLLYLYAEAMKKGTDSKSVRLGLYGIKNYEGASGEITFDKNGDVIKPFEIGKVENMNLVPFKGI